RGEFVQVLRQLDEMVFDVEPPVERLDVREALAQRLALAIADHHDAAASGGTQAWRGRRRRRVETDEIDGVDGERGVAAMLQANLERRRGPGAGRHVRRPR